MGVEDLRRRFEIREAANPAAKVILVDQDSVLADFEGEFLRRWRQRHPDYPHVPLEQRRSFYIADDYPEEFRGLVRAIHNSPGFIASLPPIPGALEALQEMKQAGHIVKICTSPLVRNVHSMKEKHVWVQRHLSLPWVRDLIITSDKTFVAGDYLIDDKPEITGLIVPTWEHIVFDTPYNRGITDGRRRISEWSQWQQILEKPIEATS